MISRNIRTSLLVGLSLLVIVLGGYAIIRAIESGKAAKIRFLNHAREKMREQIADARAGKDVVIFISNETEHFAEAMDEFAQSAKTFRDDDDFNIHIDYSHDIDDFFKQIAGARGIRKISVVQSGLTDAGLAYLSSITDLQSLSLTGGNITNTGIKAFRSNSKLEELFVSPTRSMTVSISTIASFPHLRKLTLHDPETGGWLAAAFHELKKATSLKELVLASNELSQQDIETLRVELPQCNIVLKNRNAYGK